MRPASRAPWAVVPLILTLATMVAVARAPRQLNMARLLDRYGLGEFEAVARMVVEAVLEDSRSLLPELQTGAQRWIGRGETSDIRRARRLIAAALAIEAAGAPRVVGISRDLAMRPEAQPISRFSGRSLPSIDRRALVAWAAGQVLDRRPAEPVDPAVAPGQPASALDEAERRWFLAVIALLEGVNDLGFLTGSAPPARPGLAPGALSMGDPGVARWLPHGPIVSLARRRFPDEPRFKLAEVFCDERRTAIISRVNVIAIQTQTPEDGVIPPRLLGRRPDPQAVTIARPNLDPGTVPTALALIDGVGAGYEALTAEPALRSEALLRFGYHLIRVDERVRATDTFAQVIEATSDDDERYLAHFFRGWTLHRLNRREEAERDYEAALRLRPGSRAVRALLAAVIADRGDRQTAREVLGESLSLALHPGDPWFVFHQGEYRYWPAHVVAMREHLR